MTKKFSVIFLILAILSSLAVVTDVQAETPFNGIITSDATWTMANSPYTFQGPVAVGRGVTLTIEAGVTINVNSYYLQVNGTLTAKGTSDNKIVFTAASQDSNPQLKKAHLDFTASGSGSVLENVVLPDFITIDGSVKLTQCTIPEAQINGGTPTLSGNSINKLTLSGGSPTITNNDITGDFIQTRGTPTINANTIHTKPWTRGGSPTFTGNKLYDGISADSSGGQIVIANNEISSTYYNAIFVKGRLEVVISNNKITGNSNGDGIYVSGILSSVTITQNQISGCNSGIHLDMTTAQVTKNTLTNNNIGLYLVLGPAMAGASGEFAKISSANVQYNTISQNSIGLQITPYEGSSIINNNIQDNSQYDLKLQSANDLTIANNYWGTTDTAAVAQKIFDNKNDFNVGYVTVTPVLTSPVPQYSPDLNAPIPTFSPVFTPTPTSTQPADSSAPLPTQNTTQEPTHPPNGISFNLSPGDTAILAIVIIIVVVSLTVVIIALRRKR